MSKNEPIYQQQIINRLAKEHDLSPKRVRRAVMHQFRFVRRIMSKGDFESVRLRYIGKFHVDPQRLKNLQKDSGETNKE